MYTAFGINPEIRGDTLTEVNKKFKQMLEDYKQSKTIVRKVILYKVAANAYIWDEVAKRCMYNNSEISFCAGTSLAVWAAVYNEHEITKPDGTIVYEYKEAASGIPSAPRSESCKPTWGKKAEYLLPWTEQREAFFTFIIKSMQTLILRLSEVTKDNDALLNFVDSGRLLGAAAGGKDGEKKEANHSENSREATGEGAGEAKAGKTHD